MKDNKSKKASELRKNKAFFWLSVISFFISSATILFMPLGSFETDGNVVLAYFLAAAFWVFFALGFLFILLLNWQRKRDILFARMDGIIYFRFFKNKISIAFDLLLIIGIITLALSLIIIPTLPAATTLIGTFITVFSLEMHGLFNGKNYEWLYK